MTRFRSIAHLLALLLAGSVTSQSGCAHAPSSANPVAHATVDIATQPSDPQQLSARGLAEREVRNNLDRSVSPCDDFYSFACGGWLNRTQLPPEVPSFGRGFGAVDRRISENLLNLLAGAPQADAASAQAFFRTCMDEPALERLGLQPVAPYLAAVAGAQTLDELWEVVTREQGAWLSHVLVRLDVHADAFEPSHLILTVGPPDLYLPDRSIYLEAQAFGLRDFYRRHLAGTLQLAGWPADQLDERVAAIAAFETEIARVMPTRTRQRQPELVNNHFTSVQLTEAFDLPWNAFWRGVGRTSPVVNVSAPDYLRQLGSLLRQTPLAVVRDYVYARLVQRALPLMDRRARLHDFALRQRTTGTPHPAERWRECVDTTTRSFPDEVGLLYARYHFASDRKAQVEMMLDTVRDAFARRVPQLTWMDLATRQSALDKANALQQKVGFPSRVLPSLGHAPDLDFASTLQQRGRLRWQSLLARVDGPVDRELWDHAASTMNAYYDAARNEMIFPAGILQPPYYSPDIPMAMNFGAIGIVMGHELVHAFDDSGRRYDAQGRLRSWWTPAASQGFEERSSCIVDAYDHFEALPGVHLDGRFELGENLADHGGIRLSWEAFQLWRQRVTDSQAVAPFEPKFAGFDDDQLFFVAYAQGWCTQAAPAFTTLMAKVDEHAAPKARVNLPLSHLPAFWSAFECAEDSPMHAKQVCEVW